MYVDTLPSNPSSLKQKLKRRIGSPDMFWSFGNLKRNGFSPANIIDIGAISCGKKVF
jgi:hypothetical protein